MVFGDAKIMQREYPKQPIVGVAAIIVENGKMLLIKRGSEPAAGKWSVPGGVVELGETIEEALIREVMEECGLKIEILKLIDVVDNIIKDADGRIKFHYVILEFLARPLEGEIKASSDALEVKWVPIEKIGEYNITNTLHKLLKKHKRRLQLL